VRPVAVVGSLSLDRVEGGPPRIGGGPYHCARALRVLGVPARILTKCGRADRALLVPRLAALGVPITVRVAETTHAFSMTYDGDARVMQVDAIGDPWTPEDVGDALARASAVHVAPLAETDFSPETLAAIARGGRRLSFDGQGLVRPPRTGPLELDAQYNPAVLEHVSILKLAEEEALALVPDLDRDSLASFGVPEVVVTFGLHGSLVFADGRARRVDVRPLHNVDPTGAGDAFSIAYLAARGEGHAPHAAARRASTLVYGLLSGRLR
jgi:sugar/nucleoside kinase (ribokinase family)